MDKHLLRIVHASKEGIFTLPAGSRAIYDDNFQTTEATVTSARLVQLGFAIVEIGLESIKAKLPTGWKLATNEICHEFFDVKGNNRISWLHYATANEQATDDMEELGSELAFLTRYSLTDIDVELLMSRAKARKALSYAVFDGQTKKIIYRTAPVLFMERSFFKEIEPPYDIIHESQWTRKTAKDAAMAWLDEQRPEWRDPFAYWDEE